MAVSPPPAVCTERSLTPDEVKFVEVQESKIDSLIQGAQFHLSSLLIWLSNDGVDKRVSDELASRYRSAGWQVRNLMHGSGVTVAGIIIRPAPKLHPWEVDL